jgi:hypothetical protein
MPNLKIGCALACGSFLAAPVWAHHSPAQFDLTKDATLEGTIASLSWRNPHVYFEIDVAQQDGTSERQRIEAGPLSNMVTLGFGTDSLRVGERVTVQVKPNRNPAAHAALGWMLTKADGTAIPLHVRATPPSAPSSAATSTLAGTWVPRATEFSALAVAARAWPLTEAGAAAVEATQAARDASRSACTPYGPPALMALPSTVIVELGEREVTFRLDVMGTVRTVHLDETAHPANLEPSVHGHSIGHWENAALVIDTVGYAAHPDGYAFDRPSSASKHVVERLTLAANGTRIDYAAIVEDPEYLAAPIDFHGQWDHRPEQRPSNVPCDAESAGQFVKDY